MARCSRCGGAGGKGRPALCGGCYDGAMRDQAEAPSTLEHVMQNPAVQRLFDRGMVLLNDKIDQVTGKVVGRIDSYAQLAMQMAQAKQAAETAAPKSSPREILHFGPDEQLTVDAIKQRKRALASMVHPDKNGSTEAMQAINEAADLLTKEVVK